MSPRPRKRSLLAMLGILLLVASLAACSPIVTPPQDPLPNPSPDHRPNPSCVGPYDPHFPNWVTFEVEGSDHLKQAVISLTTTADRPPAKYVEPDFKPTPLPIPWCISFHNSRGYHVHIGLVVEFRAEDIPKTKGKKKPSAGVSCFVYSQTGYELESSRANQPGDKAICEFTTD